MDTRPAVLEEISNQSDTEESGGERGGGRYNLREGVGPPNRFVPGAYNVSDGTASAALPEIKASELNIPKHYAEALGGPQREYWLQAMQEELDAINENDTYEYVSKPTDVKVLPLMWVYALKQDEYGNVLRFKARLVAQAS